MQLKETHPLKSGAKHFGRSIHKINHKLFGRCSFLNKHSRFRHLLKVPYKKIEMKLEVVRLKSLLGKDEKNQPRGLHHLGRLPRLWKYHLGPNPSSDTWFAFELEGEEELSREYSLFGFSKKNSKEDLSDWSTPKCPQVEAASSISLLEINFGKGQN